MELNSPDRLGGDKGEQSSGNGDEHLLLEGINGIQSYSYLPGPASPKDGFSSPRSVPISLRIVDERWRNPSESKSPRFLRNPVNPDSPSGSLHHVGHKFHEVFQLKQGRFSDLPPAKISEMLKSASLDNAPTQSLLSVVNGILDESMDKKNGEIPYRVACLLRKVVQEIERRLSTQAEHIRNQNNLIKARDEKYQSRIRLLETLANGTGEEALIYMSQLQQTKNEKSKIEEMKKFEEENVVRLTKEKANSDEIIVELKKELEASKKLYEERCLYLELDARGVKTKLEERLSAAEKLLLDSTKKIGELETCSALEAEHWSKKEHSYRELIDTQFHTLKELRLVFNSTKEEVLITQRIWQDEFNEFEINLKELADAAQNYHLVLTENRKLYNEVQDLKGNIRVYCRIRPFLQGQGEKNTAIEYIGEDGELLVAHPSKKGKEGHRLFKFDKVFGPSASQAEVFSDTRPLIRSVLDGYNVCIFAYGQTGSGKTYTMAGPEGASEDAWGVNYRALNDLFNISRSRRSSFMYELGVQMIEIYNEQVRDLLLDNGGQKRLGIWSTSQPNGLAVPEASMHPVKSTEDVLELMEIGQMNRAVGATALNLRSSRSHSVLTVHVRGADLETGAVLRGSLNLVDLAGSERVNRSEATGDRLKEAQHINKSLSALGDVVFALSQKSSHVPYRNSKLTQVLQSSLGGQAKTLMFVQLNPDIESYSESMSTLKFAERVSGVELGAARSNKEGKDVRDLLEQVATLKDIIAKKDDEIEQLQHLKDLRTLSPNMHQSSFVKGSIRHASSSPSISAIGKSNPSQRLSRGREVDSGSDYNDKHSEASSQQSTDDMKHDSVVRQKDSSGSSPNLGNGDGESEGRLSDISDGSLYMGAETDSIDSAVDVASEGGRSELATEKRKKLPAYAPAQHRTRQTLSSRLASKDQLRMPVKVPVKASTSVKKSANHLFSKPSTKPAVKQWH